MIPTDWTLHLEPPDTRLTLKLERTVGISTTQKKKPRVPQGYDFDMVFDTSKLSCQYAVRCQHNKARGCEGVEGNPSSMCTMFQKLDVWIDLKISIGYPTQCAWCTCNPHCSYIRMKSSHLYISEHLRLLVAHTW